VSMVPEDYYATKSDGGHVVEVQSPATFRVALKQAVAATSCSSQDRIAADIFGTITYYDARNEDGLVDLAFGKPMTWLSGPETLSMFLNDEARGCCSPSVVSLQACFCRIALAVGIIDEATNESYVHPVPPNRYVYVALRAGNAASSSVGSSSSSLRAIVPTWSNLLEAMPKALRPALGALVVPRCSPSDHVSQLLANYSYHELFMKFEADFRRFGAGAEACEVPEPELYLGLGEQLCESPVAMRLFLCSYLDANPLFEGTGITSGGTPEYVLIPTPTLFSARRSPTDASVLEMELPPGFHCLT